MCNNNNQKETINIRRSWGGDDDMEELGGTERERNDKNDTHVGNVKTIKR